MFQRFFHAILLRRHFWRYATFSEIAELYTSRMLRLGAVYIAASFISIYLFQIGYPVVAIAMYWAGFYLFKAIIMLPLTAVVGWIGPKHAILISNIIYMPAMVGFAFLPIGGTWLLIPILVFEAISVSLYTVAYAIDFSKVKSNDHAGKEIGYMNIIEKTTIAISPVIGGAVAFCFGPQATVATAAVLFLAAAAPLLATAEPIQQRTKLKFRGFPWRMLARHSLAQASIGFDVFTSGTVWSLFTAILVIGISQNNEIYLVSGLLTSVVFVTAIIASYAYGKLIDRRQGQRLMRYGAIANAATHLMRPFVTSPVVVAGLNATNEAATTGYTMPYTRAVFDNADLSGSRVTYLGFNEMIANLGAALAAGTLAVLVIVVGEQSALTHFFFITAVVALAVLTARFPLYRR